MDIIINEGVTKMKTLKARHKLIPAIVMLIVAAITMTTASYAWFTMSTQAQVTGIELTVTAPNNLLIRTAKFTDGNNVEVGLDGGWGNIANFGTPKYYTTLGKLSHGSSHDGVKIYTVDENDAHLIEVGGALTGTPTLVDGLFDSTDVNFINNYVDYVFEIANTGTGTVKVGLQDLVVEAIANTDNDDLITKDIEDAVRVAILLYDTKTPVGIYSSHDDQNKRFTDAYDSDDDTTTVVTFNSNDGAAEWIQLDGISKAPANGDGTYVLVRVWIEGQDPMTKTGNAGGRFKVDFDLVVEEDNQNP